MKKRQSSIFRNEGLAFIAPSLLGVAIFVLLPFADVLRRSFFTAGGKFAGLSNYAAVLNNTAFRLAAGNTLKFVMLCIPVLTALSLLLAAAAHRLSAEACRSCSWVEVAKTVLLLPLAVPAASVALIWKLFFCENGFLDVWFLQWFGHPAACMETETAFYVLVFSYLWKNAGYDMVLWSAGLSGIPRELYQAAEIDGAGGFARFRYITIPQLLPMLFTIFVLSLLNSFQVFREAYLVAGEYPHTSMYMLQHLFNHWFADLELEKLYAAAVLTALVIFLLILALQKSWKAGIAD